MSGSVGWSLDVEIVSRVRQDVPILGRRVLDHFKALLDNQHPQVTPLTQPERVVWASTAVPPGERPRWQDALGVVQAH